MTDWQLCDGGIYIGYCEPADDTDWHPDDVWFLKASIRRRSAPRLPDDIFGCYAHHAQPTHWMPLPSPPTGDDILT
jgi:hypothetical protein